MTADDTPDGRVPGGSARREAREAREACGWTVDEAAEALGVLPAEVAAWETGTLRPADPHRRWMRWFADTAAGDRALTDAGVAPCPWIVAHREPLARRAEGSAAGAAYARDALIAHRRSCAECARVLAATGAPPRIVDLPRPAGPRGLLRPRRSIEPPSRRRRLLRRAGTGAVLVAALGTLWVYRHSDADGWRWLAVAVTAMGAAAVARRLEGRHPRFAGSVRAAVVVACLFFGGAALAESGGLAALSWLVPLYLLASGWLSGHDAPPGGEAEPLR